MTVGKHQCILVLLAAEFSDRRPPPPSKPTWRSCSRSSWRRVDDKSFSTNRMAAGRAWTRKTVGMDCVGELRSTSGSILRSPPMPTHLEKSWICRSHWHRLRSKRIEIIVKQHALTHYDCDAHGNAGMRLDMISLNPPTTLMPLSNGSVVVCSRYDLKPAIMT